MWGVLQGDCRTHLARIPTDSADLVLTSPPYENRRYYGSGFKLKGEKFVTWLVEICLELARVSRGLVVVNIQGATDNYKWSAVPFLLGADLHRAGLHLRRPNIYFRHSVAGSGGPDYFRNDHELCVVFSKYRRKLPWSNPLACGHPPKWAPGGAMSHRLPNGKRVNQWGQTVHSSDPRRPHGARQQSGARPSHVYHRVGDLRTKQATNRKPHGRRQERQYTPPKFANPGDVVKALYTAEDVAWLLNHYGVPGFGDVLHCLVGGGHMGDAFAHENHAPFSLRFVDRYVRSFVPPGGLVYDPFAGSGSTLKGAVLAGRKALGSELDADQVALIKRRMKGVTAAAYEELADRLAALAIFDEGKEDPRRIAEALALRLFEEEHYGHRNGVKA